MWEIIWWREDATNVLVTIIGIKIAGAKKLALCVQEDTN